MVFTLNIKDYEATFFVVMLEQKRKGQAELAYVSHYTDRNYFTKILLEFLEGARACCAPL